jgi:hypothetical protein
MIKLRRVRNINDNVIGLSQPRYHEREVTIMGVTGFIFIRKWAQPEVGMGKTTGVTKNPKRRRRCVSRERSGNNETKGISVTPVAAPRSVVPMIPIGSSSMNVFALLR